jgi:hypothetical protein
MSTDKPIPSVLAMLLCDTCITDVATAKKTLVGLFDGFFTLTDFPLVTQQAFSLYAKLTDMEGQYAMSIDIVSLEDEQRLATFTIPVQAPANRLEVFELLLMFPPGLKLERPGRYEFQLYADEIFVGRCTAKAEKREAVQ